MKFKIVEFTVLEYFAIAIEYGEMTDSEVELIEGFISECFSNYGPGHFTFTFSEGNFAKCEISANLGQCMTLTYNYQG